MKRIILIAIATFLSAACFAQSTITGTWKSNESKTDKQDWGTSKANTYAEYTLNKDNSFSQKGNLVFSLVGNDGKSYDYEVSFAGVGTWKRDGDKLTLTYDPKKSVITEKKNTFEGVFKMFASGMTKEMKKAMKSKKPSVQQIVSLTNSELKIKDLSDKRAEVKTLTR